MEVSRMLNIGQTTVRKIWLKYTESGIVDDMKKTGRPKIFTERETRLLLRTSKRFPFMTAQEVFNESFIMKNASIRSVRTYLRSGGLIGRKAAKKTMLSKANIKKRLLWCKAYSSLSMNDWKHIIFSDESRVELTSSYRRYVRRPQGQWHNPKYTCKTVHFCSQSVLVWGAIKGDGSRKLLKCPHRLNSDEYQGILKKGLHNFYDNTYVFMQDGAPCHRSKSTLRYLDRRKVCIMTDWPPQSPDLNVIENLWSILKRNVAKVKVNSQDELWSRITQEFAGISNDYVKNLYESIPKRIKAVIKNKGLPCKY